MSLRIGNGTYDHLYAYARAHGLNVAAVIRRAIEIQIVADRPVEPR